MFINYRLSVVTCRCREVLDLSKVVARPYMPAVDRRENLVYVPTYEWMYVDSDGSVVLDFRRFKEWEDRTGYVIVEEPLSTCDEVDCYRDWVECDKFVLYPNFEIVEMDEKSYTLKVRRKSDGTVFKIVNDIKWFYFMPEIEPGATYCEAILLFIVLLAKLKRLKPEEEELLEKDPVALAAKFGEILLRPILAYGIIPGLILIEKR